VDSNFSFRTLNYNGMVNLYPKFREPLESWNQLTRPDGRQLVFVMIVLLLWLYKRPVFTGASLKQQASL